MTAFQSDRVQILVQRYLDCWSRADIQGLTALYASDFQYHDLTSGTVVARADIEGFLEDTFANEGRSSLVFHDVIYPNKGTVFVHWTQSLKVPGKRGAVRIGGVELLVVRGEKIVSVHEFYDYRPPDPAESDAAVEAAQAEQLRKLGLAHEDVADIKNRAATYLSETDAFLDPDVTLQKIASAIGVTRNQLSYVLNNVLDVSFYDWINAHRITFVIDQMRDETLRFSVVASAMEAGFNSISGFYGAFKKQTGLTPTAYRKNLTQGTPKDSNRTR